MSRSKPTVEYMVELDGIRALAVVGVIAEHWASGLPRVVREFVLSLDLGGLGVQCFFVLSGFLITLILLNTKDRRLSFGASLGHFYVRRVLRIFPAYYLALLVSLLLFHEMRGVVAWHALYLSNLYPVWNGTWPAIGGHFWSLSVEEQFYLFWPLLVLALSPRKVMVIALICCLLAPFLRLLVWQTLNAFAAFMLMTSALDLLCFGAFLACVKHEFGLSPDSRYTEWLRLIGLVALFIYIVIYFYFHQSWLFVAFERTLTALFFGALIVTAGTGFKGLMGWLLSNRVIVWLGAISYGLYIFHPFIPMTYLLLMDLFGFRSEVAGIYYVRYPLMLFMLLLVTSGSYYGLERPVRGLRKYFL